MKGSIEGRVLNCYHNVLVREMKCCNISISVIRL